MLESTPVKLAENNQRKCGLSTLFRFILQNDMASQMSLLASRSLILKTEVLLFSPNVGLHIIRMRLRTQACSYILFLKFLRTVWAAKQQLYREIDFSSNEHTVRFKRHILVVSIQFTQGTFVSVNTAVVQNDQNVLGKPLHGCLYQLWFALLRVRKSYFWISKVWIIQNAL